MNIDTHINTVNIELDGIISEILKAPKDKFKIGQFHTNQLFDPGTEFNSYPNTKPEFKHILAKLDDYYGDCIYWFETETTEDAIKLDNLLSEYRSKKQLKNSGYRAVPTTNKLAHKDKTFYLGVRKGKPSKRGLTNIMGRINQHLGYYKNARTQGLQLYHWAKDADVTIIIHCVHFNQDLGPLLYVLEHKLANKLHPHCGRH
ncbi:hypothetical protein [Dokdonia sp. Asnod1-B02]|uniref:hypothetical protein n=1 Tax=Dokdonia sp. Asnod1-B02 TaxID=3160573 RepID=UPI0038645C2D